MRKIILSLILRPLFAAYHHRAKRDAVEPFHNYQGLDLTHIYDNCDKNDLYNHVIKNPDYVYLDCYPANENTAPKECTLTCTSNTKITEFNTNNNTNEIGKTFSASKFTCHQLEHIGDRPFYYWTYENGDANRDFNKCIFDPCPDLIEIKSAKYNFKWNEKNNKRMVGEISLNKIDIAKSFARQSGQKNGVLQEMMEKGWTLAIFFNKPIKQGHFQTYYGQGLSSDKEGSFIAFHSYEMNKNMGDANNRDGNGSNLFYNLTFALFAEKHFYDSSESLYNNEEVKAGLFDLEDDSISIKSIKMTIGEYDNIQCVTDRDRSVSGRNPADPFESAGRYQHIQTGDGYYIHDKVMVKDYDNQNVVNNTSLDQMIFEPEYNGIVPFELGGFNNDIFRPNKPFCANGKGAWTNQCSTREDREICTDCDQGYYLDTFTNKCQPKMIYCNCPNGQGHYTREGTCEGMKESRGLCDYCNDGYTFVHDDTHPNVTYCQASSMASSNTNWTTTSRPETVTNMTSTYNNATTDLYLDNQNATSSWSTPGNCNCTNGIGRNVTDINTCQQFDSEFCISCSQGYELTYPSNTTEHQICQKIQVLEPCPCINGEPNWDYNCASSETESCKSCIAGWQLNNKNKCNWKWRNKAQYFPYASKGNFSYAVEFCSSRKMNVGLISKQEERDLWHNALKNFWKNSKEPSTQAWSQGGNGNWLENGGGNYPNGRNNYESWQRMVRNKNNNHNHATVWFEANGYGLVNSNKPMLQFNLWHRNGQPDNNGGHEDCVSVTKEGSNLFYYWSDVDCDKDLWVVCEKRPGN